MGIDVSSGNIEKARSRFPDLEFQTMDMQALDFPDKSFDLVYSSLAIHYLQDWRPVLSEWSRVLKDDGQIVFSTHHPASWSGLKEEDETSKRQLLGYAIDKSTGNIEFFGDYISDRQVNGKFGGKFEVSYFHKPFSNMLREIRESGLDILDCVEPTPVKECELEDPAFWEVRNRYPLFILFKISKKVGVC